jgi:hypothetical protein
VNGVGLFPAWWQDAVGHTAKYFRRSKLNALGSHSGDITLATFYIYNKRTSVGLVLASFFL